MPAEDGMKKMVKTPTSLGVSREKLPDILGYEYDFVNSSALMNVLKVEKGKSPRRAGGRTAFWSWMKVPSK